MRIGIQIKLLRVTWDMSQKEMADSLGISQNYLSLVENGHSLPSTKLLAKIVERTDAEFTITKGTLILKLNE